MPDWGTHINNCATFAAACVMRVPVFNGHVDIDMINFRQNGTLWKP
jgi:hypothetical protein